MTPLPAHDDRFLQDAFLDRVLQTHLRDGRPVSLRRVTPADEEPLCGFIEGLGVEARRTRFFSGGVDIETMAHSVAATGPGRLGLLALKPDGTVLGHAVAIELDATRSEVAVEVSDELHGQGLGTILIERLAELAEALGVETFVAQVLPDNRAMLDVFKEGFDAHVRWHEGVDLVEFPTASWRLARARYPDAASVQLAPS